MRVDIPILLTACVHANAPMVTIQNSEERISLTIESIKKFVDVNPLLKLVVCDGSNYDLRNHFKESFDNEKIEFLRFNSNTKLTWEYGKGFGEGEIIKFALANSKILAKSDHFIKCTAKLWVGNLGVVLDQYNDFFQIEMLIKNYHDPRKIYSNWVDTRIWIGSKHFYLNNLINLHEEVRDRERRFMEHVMSDKLNSLNIPYFSLMFPTPPLVYGVSGTTGQVYDPLQLGFFSSLKRFIKRGLLIAADIYSGRSKLRRRL